MRILFRLLTISRKQLAQILSLMQEKTGAAGQGVYWNCREKNNTVTDRIDTKQALHPEDAAEWERTIQVAFLKMEQNISVPLVLGF